MKRFALAVAVLALASATALAEDLMGADTTAPPTPSEDNTPAVLTGTLKTIHDSGVVTIGYRQASFPFSYVRPRSPEPLGYSIDLCLGVIDELVRELNGSPTRVAYVPVTAETRIDAVRSGQ
jgi:glutamate/aspartate transport system substrate-binding protein